MAKRNKFSKSETPQLGSLFAEPTQWLATQNGTAGFARCLKVSRNSHESAEAAKITVPTEIGVEYNVAISCSDVVGKIQVVINGHPLITSTGTGRNQAKFTAEKPSAAVTIRCVDRMDACGTITDLTIEQL